jgi:hypothetical protein
MRIAGFVLSLVFGFVAVAQDHEPAVLRFEGSLDSSVLLRIEEPGEIEAVAVYTQPADELAAVFVHGTNGRASKAASAWLARTFGSIGGRFPQATLPFRPGIAASMQIPSGLKSASSLRVVVVSAAGESETIVTMDPDAFAFVVVHAGGSEGLCCTAESGASCRTPCPSK